ncbi:MAG: carbamoyltransferase [Deltaproteobacteria bacterium]|nr:carbamoyltransferase [Deltaproteobacteria bacterium]
MNILGISAFYHDSAAALLKDGEIVAAAQEERFTRKKHDPSFPGQAVKFCLQYGGLSLSELDAVVFYDKPFLKFERLLETYYAFAPRGLKSFLSAIPVWVKEKVFLKKLIRDELAKIEPLKRDEMKLLFTDHHLSHAASAFFPSPYRESAILTIDGVGEWATASIGFGKDNGIQVLKEMKFPHSVGLLYSAFTYYLGFRVNSGEYKLMGLAPYGDPGSDRVGRYRAAIREYLVDVKEDGSIWLNQEYFDYATGLSMVEEDKWEQLFGLPRRRPESDIEQCHGDLAFAIQQLTEEIVLKMAKTAKRLTDARTLCLSGGVALNCVANGNLLKKGIFDDIWIQSAAGDAGGALGAAYAAYHMYFDRPRVVVSDTDRMQGAYLGPEFSELDIRMAARQYKAPYQRYEDTDVLCKTVAEYLSQGKAVGWFQGRMEWGPRALGNRSILGDARNKEMQKRLNLKIKFRESFRPFAPSVLYEDLQDYFEMEKPSPYMLLIADVRKDRRYALPEDYHQQPIRDKLYYVRSDVPAITHLDYSARLQTVHRETNPRFWALLNAFKDKTGYGVMINTSFNVRGEPIVCTPDDAYKCFMRTEMDYLVMGNFVFSKAEQPKWQEKQDWREEYGLD